MSEHVILIGCTRCGTTSLYNYLGAHPQVNLAKGQGQREVHFFDYEHLYQDGIEWYRAQFKPNAITCETSPTMLQHWLAPERLRYHLPDCKLIVLLRNPVDRAYSDYWLAVRKGWVTGTFEHAIEGEAKRLAWELKTPNFWQQHFYLSEHHLCGFLERGLYAKHLKRWLEYFPAEQIRVIKSETFFARPAWAVRSTWDWLGLPDAPLPKFRIWQQADYPALSPATRAKLEKHYARPNAELKELLGWTF